MEGISTELLDYMKQVRRFLHGIPELSLEEHETSAFVKNELARLGYTPVSIAETGVYADLVVDPALPWLLFRADMDALPVEEKTGLPFCSRHPGKMHACGHDGHTAMLLGAAAAFRSGEFCSRYNLRFAFQPAEEQYGGAKRMIEAGVLPSPLAGAFGLHLWPAVPYGKIGWRRGTLMASNDRFSVRFHGKGAHAAMQNTGLDALQAGVSFVSQLNALPARILPQNRAALAFIGSMKAGTGYNIVAQDCALEGTVRVLTPEDRDTLEDGIRTLADAVACMHHVTADVEYVRQYPPLVTGQAAAEQIVQLFEAGLLWQAPEPFMTAEDFAYFTECTEGGMLLIGCGSESYPHPLHSDRFDFDENLMQLGLQVYKTLACGDWGVQ